MLCNVSSPVRQQHVLSCLRGTLTHTATRQASGAVHRPFVNANTRPKAPPRPNREQPSRYQPSREQQSRHQPFREQLSSEQPRRPYPPKSFPPRDLRPTSHHVPRSNDAQKHLLDPYVLSKRLLKLCVEGKTEDAVVMLKNAPKDAQNTIVWNGLIRDVMAARKYQVGFQLFTDMKRRGHKPTPRTFGTLLKAYADIQDWSTYSKQLDNVHSIYENYKQVEEFYKEHKPNSKDLSNRPTNMYLRILGNAGQYQKMFDVFNDMPEDGLCAVDEVTYTLMFGMLTERTEGSDPDNKTKMAHQNASDAKLLWKRFMKLVEKEKVTLDGPLLTCAIRVLAMGRPSDQLLAFDIVRDYCGLCKPGETSTGSRIKLHPSLLSSCIDLCMISQKPRLVIHFLQQVMDRPVPSGETPPLDRGHMQTMLIAYSQLAALGSMGESEQALETLEWMHRISLDYPALHERMHPTIGVYEKAFSCFLRGKDWRSATKALELMTGYRAEDFCDNVSVIPKGRTQGVRPNVDVLRSMACTALDTNDHANMRQCLRILLAFRAGDMLREASDGAKEVALGAEKSSDPKDVHRRKQSTYYTSKLAEAIIEMVKTVASSAAPNDNDVDGNASTKPERDVRLGEHMRWTKLKDTAGVALEKLGESDWKPSWEESLLGSKAGLAAIEGSLEKPRTRRTSYMARWSDTLLQQ